MASLITSKISYINSGASCTAAGMNSIFTNFDKIVSATLNGKSDLYLHLHQFNNTQTTLFSDNRFYKITENGDINYYRRGTFPVDKKINYPLSDIANLAPSLLIHDNPDDASLGKIAFCPLDATLYGRIFSDFREESYPSFISAYDLFPDDCKILFGSPNGGSDIPVVFVDHYSFSAFKWNNYKNNLNTGTNSGKVYLIDVGQNETDGALFKRDYFSLPIYNYDPFRICNIIITDGNVFNLNQFFDKYSFYRIHNFSEKTVKVTCSRTKPFWTFLDFNIAPGESQCVRYIESDGSSRFDASYKYFFKYESNHDLRFAVPFDNFSNNIYNPFIIYSYIDKLNLQLSSNEPQPQSLTDFFNANFGYNYFVDSIIPIGNYRATYYQLKNIETGTYLPFGSTIYTESSNSGEANYIEKFTVEKRQTNSYTLASFENIFDSAFWNFFHPNFKITKSKGIEFDEFNRITSRPTLSFEYPFIYKIADGITDRFWDSRFEIKSEKGFTLSSILDNNPTDEIATKYVFITDYLNDASFTRIYSDEIDEKETYNIRNDFIMHYLSDEYSYIDNVSTYTGRYIAPLGRAKTFHKNLIYNSTSVILTYDKTFQIGEIRDLNKGSSTFIDLNKATFNSSVINDTEFRSELSFLPISDQKNNLFSPTYIVFKDTGAGINLNCYINTTINRNNIIWKNYDSNTDSSSILTKPYYYDPFSKINDSPFINESRIKPNFYGLDLFLNITQDLNRPFINPPTNATLNSAAKNGVNYIGNLRNDTLGQTDQPLKDATNLNLNISGTNLDSAFYSYQYKIGNNPISFSYFYHTGNASSVGKKLKETNLTHFDIFNQKRLRILSNVILDTNEYKIGPALPLSYFTRFPGEWGYGSEYQIQPFEFVSKRIYFVPKMHSSYFNFLAYNVNAIKRAKVVLDIDAFRRFSTGSFYYQLIDKQYNSYWKSHPESKTITQPIFNSNPFITADFCQKYNYFFFGYEDFAYTYRLEQVLKEVYYDTSDNWKRKLRTYNQKSRDPYSWRTYINNYFVQYFYEPLEGYALESAYDFREYLSKQESVSTETDYYDEYKDILYQVGSFFQLNVDYYTSLTYGDPLTTDYDVVYKTYYTFQDPFYALLKGKVPSYFVNNSYSVERSFYQSIYFNDITTGGASPRSHSNKLHYKDASSNLEPYNASNPPITQTAYINVPQLSNKFKKLNNEALVFREEVTDLESCYNITFELIEDYYLYIQN